MKFEKYRICSSLTCALGGALSICVLSLFSACSSLPSYAPEIKGEGAVLASHGVVYSIPPGSKNLEMKVVSKGMNKDRLLVLRLYFYRPTLSRATHAEMIDPRECHVNYGTLNHDFHPAFVHANSSHRPRVELGDQSKQMIELSFPIPNDVSIHEGVQSFVFHWKVHDGQGKTVSEQTVFDKNDSTLNAPLASDFPEDLDSENFWDVGSWTWW